MRGTIRRRRAGMAVCMAGIFRHQKDNQNQYLRKVDGSPSRTRTYDLAINSRALYQLSYRGTVRRQREAAYSKTNPLLQSRIGKNFTFIPKPAVSL